MIESYDLLADPIRRALWDMQWEALRQIQHDAIQVVLKSANDLIISARTASGKTEAAFLPILSELSDDPGTSVRALYVGPLRALINDQFRRLETLCTHAAVPVHRWHGDVSQSQKHNLVKHPGGVLLITPESLEALFVRRSSQLARLFGELSFVVIDELHALHGSERGTQLRSLLFRLDRYCVQPPRIVALSATLGDPKLSAEWMRPGSVDRVRLVTDTEQQKSIRYGIFGFTQLPALPHTDPDDEPAAPSALTQDLYDAFVKDKNLIFANSKADVEWYTDELNQLAMRDGRPGQFLVHHGAVSKEVREQTEHLMQGERPYTTLCTSSLELGIDIGNVATVGQIGCPWSVSSLVQRLGRSGRRDDQPQVMRMYLTLREPPAEASLVDRLYPDLIRAIALTELMLAKWVEPPDITIGDLSTLTQQILSIIAETGGLSPASLHSRLVVNGGFQALPADIYRDLLRSLAARDLIEQSPAGDLILGLKGEEVVQRYEFYAAFHSSVDYRVVHQGQLIGMLPPPLNMQIGEHLLLAGRRWRVSGFSDAEREIAVLPAHGRKLPAFSSSSSDIHDKVVLEMRRVLTDNQHFQYANPECQRLLTAARSTAANCQLAQQQFIPLSATRTHWFPWCGTKAVFTLSLMLESIGITAAGHVNTRFPSIELDLSAADLQTALADIARRSWDPIELANQVPYKQHRKHDSYLTEDLLNWSLAKDRIQVDAAMTVILGTLR